MKLFGNNGGDHGLTLTGKRAVSSIVFGVARKSYSFATFPDWSSRIEGVGLDTTAIQKKRNS